MSGYVLGIDTGATKSHLALFDLTGSLVEFSHWGPLNHEVLPGLFDQFEEELGQFINQTLSKNGIAIHQIEYAVFGIAGVDTGKQHGIVSEIIKRLGIKTFTLANDAFLGIPAGSPTGTGICAINGTGSTLAGINQDHRMLQIGGVGFISADYGGGGMLGEKVISTVYSELFRKGRPTCMTPALLKKLDITSKFDFVDKMYEKIADGSLEIAACAKMLFEAVLAEDKAAAEIVHDMAASYACGISCMIEEMEFHREEELTIVFAGSVFVKSEHPLLLDTIKKKIKLDNPGYRVNYVLLDVPPVAGAVIWAFNMLYNKGIYHDTVCNQFRSIEEKKRLNP